MKALVLAGGALHVTPALRELAQSAELVIAADSGLRHARTLGVRPQLLVGDLDSVSAAELARYPGLERRTFPRRKDQLDLELAMLAATERGARELTLLGALGGRLDQTLAALFVALRCRAAGPRVALHDGRQSAYPLVAPEVLELPLPSGVRFSLLSVSPSATLDLAGAEYPLEREALPFGVGRGVSNRVARPPLAVSLHQGQALLVLEDEG